MTNLNKTLESIKEEVGKDLFRQWEDYAGLAYFHNQPDSQYELFREAFIRNRYCVYKSEEYDQKCKEES